MSIPNTEPIDDDTSKNALESLRSPTVKTMLILNALMLVGLMSIIFGGSYMHLFVDMLCLCYVCCSRPRVVIHSDRSQFNALFAWQQLHSSLARYLPRSSTSKDPSYIEPLCIKHTHAVDVEF